MCVFNFLGVILAIVSVNEIPQLTKAYRVVNKNGDSLILALENERVPMECKADISMTYCAFVHPSGKRLSSTEDSTNGGKCSIPVNVTVSDEGKWRCFIGTRSAGIDRTETIQLRIVDEIAAVESNVTAESGTSQTLYCVATRGFVPLSYCRFEPPFGEPFSIDATVTQLKPLLNKYYFPSNKSLDRGDCAVTIREVGESDDGVWTCGAGFNDGYDHVDVIHLTVEGTISMKTAVNIIFGVLGVLGAVLLLGYVAWRRQRCLGLTASREENIEIHELEHLQSHRTPEARIPIPTIVIKSPSVPSEPGTPSPLLLVEETSSPPQAV